MVIYTYNPSTWKVETGRWDVQSQPMLYDIFKDKLRLHETTPHKQTNKPDTKDMV